MQLIKNVIGLLNEVTNETPIRIKPRISNVKPVTRWATSSRELFFKIAPSQLATIQMTDMIGVMETTANGVDSARIITIESAARAAKVEIPRNK